MSENGTDVIVDFDNVEYVVSLKASNGIKFLGNPGIDKQLFSLLFPNEQYYSTGEPFFIAFGDRVLPVTSKEGKKHTFKIWKVNKTVKKLDNKFLSVSPVITKDESIDYWTEEDWQTYYDEYLKGNNIMISNTNNTLNGKFAKAVFMEYDSSTGVKRVFWFSKEGLLKGYSDYNFMESTVLFKPV